MKQKEYKKLLGLYKKNILSNLNHLEKVEFPFFNELPIDCRLLNEEYLSHLVSNLNKNGVTDTSRILYYFTIAGGDPKLILSTVKKLKSKYKSKRTGYYALPRVNNFQGDELSNTLYIGKTNSNFISRFKQHLGMSTRSSYALHLKCWAEDLKLKVVLNYGIIELPQERIHLLEQVESVLHYNVKPLLGRSGH